MFWDAGVWKSFSVYRVENVTHEDGNLTPHSNNLEMFPRLLILVEELCGSVQILRILLPYQPRNKRSVKFSWNVTDSNWMKLHIKKEWKAQKWRNILVKQ